MASWKVESATEGERDRWWGQCTRGWQRGLSRRNGWTTEQNLPTSDFTKSQQEFLTQEVRFFTSSEISNRSEMTNCPSSPQTEGVARAWDLQG